MVLFAVVVYLMYPYYRIYELEHEVKVSYDSVNMFDLQAIEEKKKLTLPVESQPKGIFAFSEVRDLGEGKYIERRLRFYFAENGKLSISYKMMSNIDYLGETMDMSFSANMDYEFVGQVLTFSNVSGDKGVIQLEGYPVTIVDEDTFVLHEYDSDGEKGDYTFTRVNPKSPE